MNEIHTKREESALLNHARLQTGILCCIFVILLVAAIFLMVQISGLKAEVQSTIEKLDVDGWVHTVDSLKTAAEAMSSVDMEQIKGTISTLKDAAENLGNVDMKQLNGAVGALKDAAGKFEEVDVDSLNSLVGSLETVASRLQNAVNAITGIFSRG